MGNVLVILIFCFSLFVFVTVLANWGSGVPSFYGYSFLSVRTASMEPVYKVGSVIITKEIDTAELKIGDVISFYSDDPAIYGTPNTHRIVSIGTNEVDKTYFVTKGDNNPIADRYRVYADKVIGRVQGNIGLAGKILSIFKNRIVIFFILIVPLVLVFLFEAKNIKKLLGTKDKAPSAEPEKSDGNSQPTPEQALSDEIERIQAEIDKLNSKTNDNSHRG